MGGRKKVAMSDKHIDRIHQTARETGLSVERILEIADTAERCFYEALAAATPETETGDMPPGPLQSFTNASRDAALVWLSANVRPKIDAAFVANLPVINGWRPDFDRSGSIYWTHESGRSATVYATPDFHDRGMVPIDVHDERGRSIADYADEPWDSTVKRYIEIVRPVLAKYQPPAWPLTGGKIQDLVEAAADGDKLAAFTLRAELRAHNRIVTGPEAARPAIEVPPKAVVTIRLVIEGDGNDAAEVVDNILDAGTLQDAICNLE